MAAWLALLTIYGMCKAVDRGMTITDVKLLGKSNSTVVVNSRQSSRWVARWDLE